MLTKLQQEAVLGAIGSSINKCRDEIDEAIEQMKSSENPTRFEYAEQRLRDSMKKRDELIKAESVLSQCIWKKDE